MDEFSDTGSTVVSIIGIARFGEKNRENNISRDISGVLIIAIMVGLIISLIDLKFVGLNFENRMRLFTKFRTT